jgi:O-antigen ligase
MSMARSHGGSPGPSDDRRGLIYLLAVLLAIAVGALTALQAGAAAALAGGLGLIAVLATVMSSAASRAPHVDLAGKRFRWVTFAWAFLLIEPIGHFTQGRTRLSAVAGVPSIENVIELSTYGVIALCVLWSLQRNRIRWRPSFLILAFPTLALLSAAWSLAPTVSLGFSFELLSAALLATFTAAIINNDPSLARDLMRGTLRVTIQGIALLCVLGLIDRSGWAPDTHSGTLRYAWPGGYPLATAAEIGFAMLVLVFGGRRDAGFSWPSRTLLLVLLGACLYLSNSRTAYAGLAVAALFGYWFISKGRGALRRLAGAAAIALTLVVLVGSFGGPITQYLYRGESQQQVTGLNGRVGLWTIGLNQVHSPGRWLVGYGLNGTRVLFAATTSWAGDAHSAWLELLLSLGLVGVAAAAALVVTVGLRLLRAPPDGSVSIRVLPILFVFVLAMSPIGGGFAAPGPEPGLGFAVLSLCYAAVAARAPAVSRSAVSKRARLSGALQPAPM